MEIKRVNRTLPAAENFAAGVLVLQINNAASAVALQMPEGKFNIAEMLVPVAEYIRINPECDIKTLISGTPVVTTLRSYVSVARKTPRGSSLAAIAAILKRFPTLDKHQAAQLVSVAASRSKNLSYKDTVTIHWTHVGGLPMPRTVNSFVLS